MNRTIVSLAIIKSHWEREKTDYIDNFIPMLGCLCIEKKYNEINIDTFRFDFKTKYGLDIPTNPMITIFNRAVKRKLFLRNNGKFYINAEKIAMYDNSIESTNIERKIKKLVDSILSFAKDKYNISPSESEVEDALLAFLKQYDLDILFATKEKSILPSIKSTKKLKYLISAFAISIHESDPVLFRFLLDVSIGHALAGAILYSGTNSFIGKFCNLNIYIDTPLILSLIGYNGNFKQKAFVELLDTLREENANLFILDTTRIEVNSILEDCRIWLDKGNYDIDKASKVLRYCHKNGITASDVEAQILRLDTTLERYNINSTSVPNHNDNKEYQIDEVGLKQTIINTYKNITNDYYLDYSKHSTIDRDVSVLSGIYRFRKGHKPKTLKECKDIFITSNTALAFASRVFETKENGQYFTIPTCLTDVFIGTIIWLQSPQKVENLNEKKFIADCYSFVQPSDALIKAYVTEIDKLKAEKHINQDEYFLLRTHRVSLNLLETTTMGDPEAFNGESIDEILDTIIKSIKGKEMEKLEEERSNHDKTKQALDNKTEEYAKLENNINQKAARLSLIIGRCIFFLLTFIFAVALFINLFPDTFTLSKSLKIIIWIGIGIITVFNIATGFNIKGFRDSLMLKVQSKITNWLKE